MRSLTAIALVLLLLFACFGVSIAQEKGQDEIVENEKSTDTFFIIIDTITVLFLLLAVFFGAQLYTLMRGGELTLSWRWLVGGAILFAIAKIIEIANLAGIIPEYEWLIRIIFVVVAIFLTLGFFQQRKVLS